MLYSTEPPRISYPIHSLTYSNRRIVTHNSAKSFDRNATNLIWCVVDSERSLPQHQQSMAAPRSSSSCHRQRQLEPLWRIGLEFATLESINSGGDETIQPDSSCTPFGSSENPQLLPLDGDSYLRAAIDDASDSACCWSPHELRGPSFQLRNVHYVTAKTVRYWHEDTARHKKRCISSCPPRRSLIARADP